MGYEFGSARELRNGFCGFLEVGKYARSDRGEKGQSLDKRCLLTYFVQRHAHVQDRLAIRVGGTSSRSVNDQNL